MMMISLILVQMFWSHYVCCVEMCSTAKSCGYMSACHVDSWEGEGEGRVSVMVVPLPCFSFRYLYSQ